MGSSQADKAASHERIIKVASRRVRRDGIGNISVAELMKQVGLTHGGFYRHFDSRDELVAEAIAEASSPRCGAPARAAYSRQVLSYIELLTELARTATRRI